MTLNAALPLASTVVSAVFALFVLDQYLSRRKPYQLVWTVALVIYGLGTLSEFLAESGGWSDGLYKSWYIFGAFFAAAYLGMGTAYLLLPRRAGHAVMATLLVLSVVAVGLVLQAHVDVRAALEGGRVGSAGMPGYVRFFTPTFNIFGTLFLVGGALYSAWFFWAKRSYGRRAIANVIIAAGGLFPAVGGSLARFGRPEFLYLSELLGIFVIFVGFLVSIEVFEQFRVPFTKVVLRARRPVG